MVVPVLLRHGRGSGLLAPRRLRHLATGISVLPWTPAGEVRPPVGPGYGVDPLVMECGRPSIPPTLRSPSRLATLAGRWIFWRGVGWVLVPPDKRRADRQTAAVPSGQR
jgi:hypothetical protein